MAEENGGTVKAGGRSVTLTHLDKVLFPGDGIAKRAVVEHYRKIAEVALPYYKDRALTQHRFPGGIGKEGFFQKNLGEGAPDWLSRAELPKEGGTVTYAVANTAADLVWLANQDCITPHLALSRTDKPDHPDRMIFDLDPSDEDFKKVQEAASWIKELLDAIGLPAFVQTTGSRGVHIVVPLDRSQAFDDVRAFARAVAEHLADAHPKALTTQHRKAKRGQRVFVDYLRNAYGQTAVAPYALRAKPGAPVATPVDWDEALASGMGPRKYTIKTIFKRLAQTEDPWAGMARRAVSLAPARKKFGKIRGKEE